MAAWTSTFSVVSGAEIEMAQSAAVSSSPTAMVTRTVRLPPAFAVTWPYIVRAAGAAFDATMTQAPTAIGRCSVITKVRLPVPIATSETLSVLRARPRSRPAATRSAIQRG